MSAPLVSAILPVFNGAKYLAQALSSVLTQSAPPDEIIVVDDGSDDESCEVAQRFDRVICVSIPHAGQAAAMNDGVRIATSQYLAFLDADDEWTSQKLALQLAQFANDPTLEAVFGFAEQIVEREGEAAFSIGTQPARLPSAMLIERSALLRVGPFDSRLRLGMVVEWYARARDAGLKETVIPDVVYRRRIHSENLGVIHSAERDEYAVALKTVVDRRRRQRGV
jgi:glycosyltransferase involved in cell wall biosynthesis